MTDAAAAAHPSPERRHFLRQGQLAGVAIGGIAAAFVTGMLPARMQLVRMGPELNALWLEGLILPFAAMVLGMAVGYLVWIMVFEHRRPSLLGRPWSGERDWAITGGLLVAYFLGLLLKPAARDGASGLYSTSDPVLVLQVDAPVDIAIVFVRYLASASITAVMLRLVIDRLQPFRARRARPEQDGPRP